MQDLDSKDELRCGRASVNRTLSMCWRRHDRHGMTRRCCVEAPAMSPQSCQMLLALALGFAFAGLCCSAYRLPTDRLPRQRLLACGPRLSSFAALALLIVAAPFFFLRTVFLCG